MFPSKDVMGPIYAAGDGIWGGSNDLDKEMTNIQAMKDSIAAEIANTPGAQWNPKFTPDSANDTIGVAALEFTRGNLTVLVFRGTYSPGDNANIRNWIYDWVFSALSARMKDAWVREAGLPWDSELRDREGQDTFKQTMALQALRWISSPYLSKGFASDLARAAARMANFSFAGGEEGSLGYWPIARRIADEARAAARARGHALHLSGHSQGGSNAQLVSMYLRKRYGEVVNGTTFGATGSACFARRLASGANLLGAPRLPTRTQTHPAPSHPFAPPPQRATRPRAALPLSFDQQGPSDVSRRRDLHAQRPWTPRPARRSCRVEVAPAFCETPCPRNL
jgi:hypothetical protein